MRSTSWLGLLNALATVGLAAGIATAGREVSVTAAEDTGVISGTVASTAGPEAGVWVIAETSDLPTKFR